jgi:hypothetical protein
MGAALALIVPWLRASLGLGPLVVAAGVLGLVIYAALLALLRVREAGLLGEEIGRRLRRP